MTAERDELLVLVQELPDDQVPTVLAAVRRLRSWPPPLFGIAPGDGESIAATADDKMRDGFGR